MISGLRADAFVESPATGSRLAVRKAVMHDIAPILHLINNYAARGIMLARTEFEMSEAIRDFTVVTLDEQLLGCGALHFYSPTSAPWRYTNMPRPRVSAADSSKLWLPKPNNTNLTPSSPSLML